MFAIITNLSPRSDKITAVAIIGCNNNDILIKGINLLEQLTEFLGLPDGEHNSEDDIQSVTAQVFKYISKTKVQIRIS